MLLLAKKAVTKLLEAFDQDRNGTRAWFLSQSFFPFRFVIFGSGPVESRSIGNDAIVKIRMEETGRALRVPFLRYELDLILYGFMTCIKETVSLIIIEMD